MRRSPVEPAVEGRSRLQLRTGSSGGERDARPPDGPAGAGSNRYALNAADAVSPAIPTASAPARHVVDVADAHVLPWSVAADVAAVNPFPC